MKPGCPEQPAPEKDQAGQRMTQAWGRYEAALSAAQQNVLRARLALATAERRLRRAQETLNRIGARKHKPDQGASRVNSASRGQAPLAGIESNQPRA